MTPGFLWALQSVLIAAGCTETTTTTPSADGPALYLQHCSACHGTEGRGIDNVAPPIRGLESGHAATIIRSGRDLLDAFVIGMPAFDATRLPEAELAAVVTHIQTFAGTAAFPPPGDVAPVFPADFESTFTEARSCRQSHEHDLHYVRVLASAGAVEPYAALNTPYPPGATLVKIEYDDMDCTTPIGYTALFREPKGYSPATFDWRWQELKADKTVILDTPYPPRCMACHVSHCDPRKSAGFELTCVDDSGGI